MVEKMNNILNDLHSKLVNCIETWTENAELEPIAS